MERNFTNENFEGFLRQNADDLRMRPSDKVWNGISKHLNRRRRIFGFALAGSLLITSTIGYYAINQQQNPASHAVSKITGSTGAQSSGTSANTTGITGITKDVADKNTRQLSRSDLPASIAITYKDAVTATTESAVILSSVAKEFTPSIVDDYTTDDQKTDAAPAEAQQQKIVNDLLTIESVVNTYKPRKSKVDLQAYFTPAVSYRKLSDNNINNVVTHKPDFGFELGLAAKRPVTKHLSVRGGLQFNVNRYDIKTFDASPQMATIRLNNSELFRTTSSYNNFGGYQTNWIKNFFFQVSAPVGLELKLKGDDNMQFGVATTLQPTYILGDKAYLISSDYKNYAEAPGLIRRWNMNTSLETFVAYSTGHLKWQVGPQVRYQLMSSYVKKYPVKENLFDFGLKVGISLNH